RVVMGVSKVWGGSGAESGSAAAGPVRTPDKGRTSRQLLSPSLYAAPPGNTPRLQLQQGPALAVKLSTFVRHAAARMAIPPICSGHIDRSIGSSGRNGTQSGGTLPAGRKCHGGGKPVPPSVHFSRQPPARSVGRGLARTPFGVRTDRRATQ